MLEQFKLWVCVSTTTQYCIETADQSGLWHTGFPSPILHSVWGKEAYISKIKGIFLQHNFSKLNGLWKISPWPVRGDDGH